MLERLNGHSVKMVNRPALTAGLKRTENHFFGVGVDLGNQTPAPGGRCGTRSFGVGFPLGRELVPAQRMRSRAWFRIATSAPDKFGPAGWQSVTDVGKGVKESGTRRGERIPGRHPTLRRSGANI